MARLTAGTRQTAANRQVVRDFGTCIRLDGTDDYIRRSAGSVYGTTGYAIELWLKGRRDLYSSSALYSEGTSAGPNPHFRLQINNTGKISSTIRNAAGTLISTGSGNIVCADNAWNHVIWNDANGVITLYINGVLDSGLQDYTAEALSLNQTAVGALWRNNVQNFFNGSVDAIRSYSRVLTQNEVLGLFYRGAKPTTPYFEWLLNEGSGSTATDSSGNGRDGSIQGTVTYSTDVFMKPRTAA